MSNQAKAVKAKAVLLTAMFLGLGVAIVLTGCGTPARAPFSATPCMAQIGRFTAADVPAMGPAESASPPAKWTNAPAPAGLPGKGLAQHPMLYVGENYTKMFLVNDGKVIWTYQTGKGYEYDDMWMLSNGNILFSRMQYVAEITPEKRVVWRYDCDNSNGTNHTEVHTCQPIGLDKVMFVVNGLPPRLMVVNTQTGAVEVNHELPYGQSFEARNIHGQFRRARCTAQGTYLLSYLSENKVVELDKNFNEVWSYPIRSPWAALRLKNGNTLITDERDSLTREVNPKGETVWEYRSSELPEAWRFVQAPQTCARLANGNTILCSRGGSGKGPQVVEVTRGKSVVWVLQDWQNLGDATAVQILDDPGAPEIPGESGIDHACDPGVTGVFVVVNARWRSSRLFAIASKKRPPSHRKTRRRSQTNLRPPGPRARARRLGPGSFYLATTPSTFRLTMAYRTFENTLRAWHRTKNTTDQRCASTGGWTKPASCFGQQILKVARTWPEAFLAWN